MRPAPLSRAQITRSLASRGAMCVDCLALEIDRDQADVMAALQSKAESERLRVNDSARQCARCGTRRGVLSLNDA